MITINIKQLKAVNTILDFMNQEWPPPEKGIPSQKYVDNKLIKFYAVVDPYFVAYYNNHKQWYICCTDYWVWKDSYETLKELLDSVDFKIIPCHISVIGAKDIKDRAKAKQLRLFIGRVSWAK